MSTSGPDQNATYTVTARKWRPTLFNGVVGQEHVTQTLRNAVLSGRVHHAYIFNGPRGVGKTTTARILAKALNCLHPGPDAEPCNECSSCTDITAGRSIDVIEIDGASNNSVDDVRKLRENAKYPPTGGRYKMYIIDEVHMLSTSAFNALLKTLEEPPRHIIFVFATTEPHRVPATILSRCQRFDFRRMQIDDIVGHLRHIAASEHITIDDESLTVIAKKGDGSMRDSQSIFDQVVSFCGTTVSYDHVNEALNLIDQEFFFTLSRAIRQHDIPTILELARQVFIRGYDLQECLNGLAEHFRNILTVIATGDVKLIETSKAFHDAYTKEAALFSQADVLQLMNIVISTEQALRFAPQPRLRFEFALIRMAKLESTIELSTLLIELEELKKKLEGTGGTLPPAPARPAAPAATAREPQTDYRVPETPPQVAPPQSTPQQPSAAQAAPTAQQTAPRQTAPAPAPAPAPQAQAAAPASAQRSSAQRSMVTAQELRQQWETFLRTSDKIDAAFKRLAKGPGMVEFSFADGEITMTPTAPMVDGRLMEKKAVVAEALQAFFGCEVAVHVEGAGSAEKLSIFDNPAPVREQPPAPAPSPAVQAAPVPTGGTPTGGTPTGGTPTGSTPTGDTPAGGTAQQPSPAPETAPQAAHGAAQEPGAGKDLHPLDRAIVEQFGAHEIPIR